MMATRCGRGVRNDRIFKIRHVLGNYNFLDNGVITSVPFGIKA